MSLFETLEVELSYKAFGGSPIKFKQIIALRLIFIGKENIICI